MQNLTSSQPFEITEIRGKILKRLEFKGETLVFIFSDRTFYLLKMENKAPYKFNFSAQPEAQKVTESIIKGVTVLDTLNPYLRVQPSDTRFLLQIDTYKGTLMYALPTLSRGMGQNGWDSGAGKNHYDPEYQRRTRYRAPYTDYNPFEPDNNDSYWREQQIKDAAEAMRNSARTAAKDTYGFEEAFRRKKEQTGKSMEEMLREELKKRMGDMGYDPWADLGFKG